MIVQVSVSLSSLNGGWKLPSSFSTVDNLWRGEGTAEDTGICSQMRWTVPLNLLRAPHYSVVQMEFVRFMSGYQETFIGYWLDVVMVFLSQPR